MASSRYQSFAFSKSSKSAGEAVDFVIDLHSLSEQTCWVFVRRAKAGLYSRRPGRSLDYLANFHPRPPVKRIIERDI